MKKHQIVCGNLYLLEESIKNLLHIYSNLSLGSNVIFDGKKYILMLLFFHNLNVCACLKLRID